MSIADREVQSMGQHKYLIVAARVLPEVFTRIIEAKELLKQGKARNVTDAARMVGISRSTYYKYADTVFTVEDGVGGNKATVTFVLTHESGVLSHLLETIANARGNVVTLSQEAPVNGVADVTVTFDVSEMVLSLDDLLNHFKTVRGVVKTRLVSIE